MTAALVALLTSFVVKASASPASACSCGRNHYKQAVAEAATAFAGTVVSVREAGRGRQVSTVAVATVYAGEVRARTELVHSVASASCGVDLHTGDELLALTYTDAGTDLNLDGCISRVQSRDGERRYDRALGFLAPGSAPLAGVRAVQLKPQAEASGGWGAWPLALLACLLGGSAALMMRRSRARPANRR